MADLALSIIIPVYNAEKTITHLCEGLIRLYGHTYRLEIVLVNDCSHDESDRVCRRLQQEYEQIITYIRLARNFGEHNALMAGLNHASGDFCVTMDDDFQNPPEEIALLIGEIADGYDVVYARYVRKNDHWFRNLGSRFNDRMAVHILKKPAGLYLSSFKIMNRFLVREIIKYTGPDPYIDGIILRTTSNIGSVQVTHSERAAGTSGYTFMKLVSLWGNMMVSFSLIPLRLMGLFGFCMTIVGLGMTVNTVVTNVFPMFSDPSEYEKLTTTIIFFRGFQLMAIALVGEYVGRIYLAINRDPQFVIRDHLAARPLPRVIEAVPAKELHASHTKAA